MISPEEIKIKAKNKYKDFLRYKVDLSVTFPVEDFFPLIIKADKGKVNDDLLTRQKELQLLISKSKNKTSSGYKLDLETVNSRKNGEQTEVSRIYFENESDYLSFINEKKSYKLFYTAISQIKNSNLLSNEKFVKWAKSHLTDLCAEPESNPFWTDVCLCADWLNKNCDSHLYIREIPLPVHTKFIEQNKKIIKSLTEKAESGFEFEATFGLKTKPDFVRFRSLSDNIILPFSESRLNECQILLDDFSKLDESFLHKIKNIFIVENEMVYLTFPQYKDSICIWGQGYKVNILNGIEWFKSKGLYYFGDLDEHGFDILSTYRRYYLQIQSFCMDKNVLEEYEQFLVEGKILESRRIPENLTEAENECFMILRDAADEKNRLEQERVSVEYIREQLSLL
ncbi:hypothetical protein HNP77_002248 [Treponema rectale]|uniref:Wadjet protein JetD C-terminal domain-containing protein n=1 Tax=Treponema rectale TaxID=744512 RepID=A0A840SAW4_9SPIR|nr:Wadjet anti-phage system protein JetD domain-containing protein [Treponema rectale]MBB5219859.1 hypothetical protein [Treponema rectale]